MTAHSRARKRKKSEPRPKRYRFFHNGTEVIVNALSLNDAKTLFEKEFGYRPK